MPAPAAQPGDSTQMPSFGGLRPVKKGEMPSAKLQNAIIGALTGSYGRNDYPGAASGCILAKTPSGGIPACTGTGPYTFGSAECTIVGDDGVVGTDTEIVKNIVNLDIDGDVIIKAERVGSIWVVDVAGCTSGSGGGGTGDIDGGSP